MLIEILFWKFITIVKVDGMIKSIEKYLNMFNYMSIDMFVWVKNMKSEEHRKNPRNKIEMEKISQNEMMHNSIFEPMKRKRGSMKFIILMMLQEQPMHGYALMKAIEDKYEHPASQGIIYPTLQMLEDQGYSRNHRTGSQKSILRHQRRKTIFAGKQ